MLENKLTPRRLALAGIVGPIVWWLLIIVNGAITPGYNHVSDFISTLGAVDAPYAVFQQINFAVFGGSLLAFTFGIHYWFGDGNRPKAGTILLGALGVGIILAGVFPENPAAPDSTTNVLHNIVSVVGFLAGIVGVGLVSRRIDANDQWPSYRNEPIWTVFIVLVTFIVFIFSVNSESPFLGLTQRLFIGVITLWIVVQAYRLYRLEEAAVELDVDADRPDSVRPV